MGTTVLVASMRDAGQALNEKRIPSWSSISSKFMVMVS